MLHENCYYNICSNMKEHSFGCTSSEDFDQPVYLIRGFVGCFFFITKNPRFLQLDSKDADQTGQSLHSAHVPLCSLNTSVLNPCTADPLTIFNLSNLYSLLFNLY